MKTTRLSNDLTPLPFDEGNFACSTPLHGAWEFSELATDPVFDIEDIANLDWKPAIVPGTVAAAWRALNQLDDKSTKHLDEREFVFRCQFPHEKRAGAAALVFDGLATLADVWLNGTHLLATRNMFRRYSVNVGELIRDDNELVIHFRALTTELSRKRPRGRWTSRLVSHRNLRFQRTTLLGRMPGWAPSNAPVGPWRAVHLVEYRRIRIERVRLQQRLDGPDGILSVSLNGSTLTGTVPTTLAIKLGDSSFSIPLRQSTDNDFDVCAEIRIPQVELWWPYNMGTPHCYPISLSLICDAETITLGTTKIGFRSIERNAGVGFGLRINGRDAFCRGACWTPVDPLGLADNTEEMLRTLALVRHAGMNMLRLSGTMIYELDAFYDACDQNGILVWQDFMFASMDYPEHDAEFCAEVGSEIEQVLARLHHHPCLAVWCGNSEIEQQAAMKGLAPQAGETPLFSVTLLEASRNWCPGTPYLSSSPTGGELPFQVDAGVAHYFGVGA